jgi:hypothetical protein
MSLTVLCSFSGGFRVAYLSAVQMLWRENCPAELASAAIEATQCYGHAFFFCHESQNGFQWEK